MAVLFTPPIAYDNPPVLPDKPSLASRLFRYYPNRARYINVFYLSDGTFVQDTPNGFAPDGSVVANANVNFPGTYNPWDPSAPFSTSYYMDYTQNPPVQVAATVSEDPYIVKTFHVPCYVSTAIAALLTAAGYGACIA